MRNREAKTMNNHRHPLVGFMLSVFPGGGQFYYGNTYRGVFYLMATIVPVLVAFILTILSGDEGFLLFAVVGLFFYLVSFIDTIIVGARRPREVIVQSNDLPLASRNVESERFFTIVLSFIPGVGHFQLGLMNRGFTFLTAFLGTGIMIFFTAVMLRQDAFLIFMAFLPVVWVYSFFDAIQQLNKKQRGEELDDRSILEDLEKSREDGRKSKAIATLLSIFPGAGHLYLGYQRRGIQLMAAFLFALYILDVLRLGIFLFLIPIIWFYSFFDGLQKASRHNGDELIEDVPVISYLVNHQRWVGIGLVVLGAYYMLDQVFIPSIAPKLTEFLKVDIRHFYYNYFQTIIVCILLIGGGFKLMIGSKAKGEDAS
jgi:hypothetical protein